MGCNVGGGVNVLSLFYFFGIWFDGEKFIVVDVWNYWVFVWYCFFIIDG